MIREGECTTRVVSCVLHQIRLALSYMHIHGGLVHNDVKPANILWTSLHSQAVLADFSLSEKHGANVPAELQATVNYRPPELLRATGSVRAAFTTDVWSFGCTVWEAAAAVGVRLREPLFPGASEYDVQMVVRDFERGTARALARVRRAGIYRKYVYSLCCAFQHRNPKGWTKLRRVGPPPRPPALRPLDPTFVPAVGFARRMW